MYLLDTNIIVELMAGNRQAIEPLAALQRARVCISAVTVAEIAYGARRSNRPEYEASRVSQLTSSFTVLPVDTSVAVKYAEIKAELASRGQLLEDNDLFIAASAMSRGFVLVTHDKGFQRIPDLKTEDWLA